MHTNLPKFRPSPIPRLSNATKFHHGELTDRIIACAILVHKELGPGFLESIYENAIALELNDQQIEYCRQLPVQIRYKGTLIGTQRLDLVIDNKVVVELKAVKEINDAHLATCLSYLKATHLQVGLIINFSAAKIRIRRVLRGTESNTEEGKSGNLEGDSID
jgi:GxxExxY protein